MGPLHGDVLAYPGALVPVAAVSQLGEGSQLVRPGLRHGAQFLVQSGQVRRMYGEFKGVQR